MKKVNFFAITALLTTSFCLISVAGGWLENIKIYEDSPRLDKVGYVGSNMEKNGELSVIKKLIKKGDVVFDVGANVGKWSRSVFAHVGDVQIHAFEPVESLYKTMKENFNSRSISIYNIALSSAEGVQAFYFYPNDTGKSGFYDRKILREKSLEPKEIVVKVRTLDDFCRKNGIIDIDFLKIDTEGEELRVLEGGYNLLKSNSISTIQFEYGGCYIDSETTLKDVYSLLSGFGYSIFRIVPQGLIRISKWRDGLENFRYSNFLAVLK